MKKFFMYFLFCLASGLMLVGCQRDRGVYAGNDDYQPRPAPAVQQKPKQDIEGELVRVNIPAKTFVVRVENGLEQTFKFDDTTEVMGLEVRSHVGNLVGKEGSEITIQSQDDGDTRIATRVDVTQLSTAKAKIARRRRR